MLIQLVYTEALGNKLTVFYKKKNCTSSFIERIYQVFPNSVS